MDLLGLAEYDSESDQENDQVEVVSQSSGGTTSQKELTSASSLKLQSANKFLEIAAHVLEGVSSSQCTTTEDFSTLCQKLENDDSQFALKYPNLSKLPKLNPNIKPDPVALETVKYHINAIKLHNFSLIENIRNDKDSGNPYILAKVVDHFQIDEIGSMYPKEMFDPHGYPEEDFIDRIFNYGMTAAPQQQQQQQQLFMQQPQQPGFQPQQQPQPSDMVSAAVATTAAAMSTIQQQMAARMNRTASYANAMADLTQQAQQYVASQQQQSSATAIGSSTASLTALTSNVHIGNSSVSAGSTAYGANSGAATTALATSTTAVFTDRHERKRKSKWDDPSTSGSGANAGVGTGSGGTVSGGVVRSQQEIAEIAASIMRR